MPLRVSNILREKYYLRWIFHSRCCSSARPGSFSSPDSMIPSANMKCVSGVQEKQTHRNVPPRKQPRVNATSITRSASEYQKSSSARTMFLTGTSAIYLMPHRHEDAPIELALVSMSQKGFLDNIGQRILNLNLDLYHESV